MKKRVVAFGTMIILCSLLFSGCGEDIFSTKEYRQMKNIYIQITEKDAVYTKADLLEGELKYPDGYYTSSGKYVGIKYGEREEKKEEILASDAITWRYTCHEMPDPSNPYRLHITFDQEGNSVTAEFEPIPGG